MRHSAVFLGFLMVSAVGLAGCSGNVRDGTPYTFDELKKDLTITGKYFWGPVEHDETQLYLNTAKIPHNSQWDNDEWGPQVWIDRRGGSAMDVINGFYEAGIVKNQYVDDYSDAPVLSVGRPYIELSPLEQRRVAAFFDHVFAITSDNPSGAFHIKFCDEEGYERQIGIFTADGLQLQ